MTIEKNPLDTVYDVAIKTPLEKAQKISANTGVNLFLKREDLQDVHSFKIRGAYNKIAGLSDEEKSNGVIAASAGNHAQGVALSAKKLNINATIVMPKTTPSIKVEAVKGFGAKVVLHGDSFSDSYTKAVEIMNETGAVFVHPFDDLDVIAGQGTVGSEILNDLPGVTHIFVPVGGGGLLAGIAQIVKNTNPDVIVIGVEPDDSNAMGKSLKAKERVELDHVGIFADGVAVKLVGEHTFKIASEFVDDLITVNNDKICAAIKSIFEETRNVCEPAGALAVAGAVKYFSDKQFDDAEIKKDFNAVCINSGANLSFERLQFIAERTLIGEKAESLFSIELPETPGALKNLYKKVIHGFSISEFSYRLTDRDRADIFIGLITSTSENRELVKSRLDEYGFNYQDLSKDEYAKEHVRFMVGGKSYVVKDEAMYSFDFPERPGALADFLDAIGSKFNISLFHYRGQGGDTGQVLMGFEVENKGELETILDKAGYNYCEVNSSSIKTFL
jgi:threonine dehydratase